VTRALHPPALGQNIVFKMIVLDAGQGDATLIVYPDYSLVLVDCGCKKNGNVVKTQISAVLTHYLNLSGNKLKALVLTHSDGDHYNLIKEMIIDTGVKVGTLFYGCDASGYTGLTKWIKNKQSGSSTIGTVFPLSKDYYNAQPIADLSYVANDAKYNIDVRILAANVGNDPNPKSVVLLVSHQGMNFFLMGDSTYETETFILNWLKTDNTVPPIIANGRTVLKVGHHGSDTSTGADWLKAINPLSALISSDTKSFNGVSIPRAKVTDRIFANNTLVQIFPNKPSDGNHHYVQYNDATDKHEAVPTTLALCTTLYLLKFVTLTEFISYGVGWYYDIADDGGVFLTPACGWSLINTAY
jgi:competence protein ComEC